MTQTAHPAPPLYQTDLAQTPLPEILSKIHQYNVPGRLECRRGEEVRRLYLDRGKIVLASDETGAAAALAKTVWSIFSWDGGNVTFIPGDNFPDLKITETPLPIREVILRGVRHMPDARSLLGRIGEKATILQRTEVPVDLSLSHGEQALLDAANGKRTMVEIVQKPGNPAENARVLYALFVLGFIGPKKRRQIKVQIKTKTFPA